MQACCQHFQWPRHAYCSSPKSLHSRPTVVTGLQGTQQGGTLVFQGTQCEWAWYDEATAAHAPPDEVVKRALET